MYACGLRIGEAATLQIGTIDSDNVSIGVQF
jgi:integrase